MLDIKKTLTKILTGLTAKQNTLTVDKVTSAQQTINGSADLNNVTFSVSKTGYTAIGIVGYTTVWVSGTTNLINYSKIELSNATTARFSCRNVGTSQAKFNLTVYVLYEAN